MIARHLGSQCFPTNACKASAREKTRFVELDRGARSAVEQQVLWDDSVHQLTFRRLLASVNTEQKSVLSVPLIIHSVTVFITQCSQTPI